MSYFSLRSSIGTVASGPQHTWRRSCGFCFSTAFTGANESRWKLVIESWLRALMCASVPYHLCFSTLSFGWSIEYVSMSRSRNTFAMIDAPAISFTFWSPQMMETGSFGRTSGNVKWSFPSMSIEWISYSSGIFREISFRARFIASWVLRLIPNWSMKSLSTTQTQKKSVGTSFSLSRIISWNRFFLFFSESFLLSVICSRRWEDGGDCGLNARAHATTGPYHGPRPASSMPIFTCRFVFCIEKLYREVLKMQYGIDQIPTKSHFTLYFSEYDLLSWHIQECGTLLACHDLCCIDCDALSDIVFHHFFWIIRDTGDSEIERLFPLSFQESVCIFKLFSLRKRERDPFFCRTHGNHYVVLSVYRNARILLSSAPYFFVECGEFLLDQRSKTWKNRLELWLYLRMYESFDRRHSDVVKRCILWRSCRASPVRVFRTCSYTEVCDGCCECMVRAVRKYVWLLFFSRAVRIELHYPFDTIFVPKHTKICTPRAVWKGHFYCSACRKSMENFLRFLSRLCLYRNFTSVLILVHSS